MWFFANEYIDAKNNRQLDNFWRYVLVSGKMALENADLGLQQLEKEPSRGELLSSKCVSVALATQTLVGLFFFITSLIYW